MTSLIESAWRLIPPSKILYRRFKSRTIDEYGRFENSYFPLEEGRGNIMSVSSDLYRNLGLDFQKEYKSVYTDINIKALKEQEAPDIIEFDGKPWSIVQITDWSEMGFVNVLVVRDKDGGE